MGNTDRGGPSKFRPQSTDLVRSLRNGRRGPAGTTIRAIRPRDLQQASNVLELIGETHVIEGIMSTCVSKGSSGRALVAALEYGRAALLPPLKHLESGFGAHRTGELGLIVVATRERRIVGCVYCVPPGSYAATAAANGMNPHKALLSMTLIVKIKGIAVISENRGQGIGTALIQKCVEVYEHLGYKLIYGEFEAGNARSQKFFRHCGFEINAQSIGINMEWLDQDAIDVEPEPGKRIFLRHNTELQCHVSLG